MKDAERSDLAASVDEFELVSYTHPISCPLVGTDQMYFYVVEIQHPLLRWSLAGELLQMSVQLRD